MGINIVYEVICGEIDMVKVNADEAIVPNGHFTWREYITLGLWNKLAEPTEVQKANAEFLFAELEKLRIALGKPLTISSGARTWEYTRFLRQQGIPAALRSAHMDWQAVDLKAPEGMSNQSFWQWCHQRWPGRMEHFSATPTWVHLDTRNWGQHIRFHP